MEITNVKVIVVALLFIKLVSLRNLFSAADELYCIQKGK